jgi:hypothetical protein
MRIHWLRVSMRKRTAFLLAGLLCMPLTVYAIDSTHLRTANIVPATHAVKLTDCIDTEETRYTVTIWRYRSVNPSCPKNYTIDKFNFRTESNGTDVDTYVSIHCCKSNVGWEEAPA